MSIFPGPTPAQTNPPINPQYYLPSVFVISAITLGLTTVVETIVPHDYVIGQNVRLVIPLYNGARALNERQGYVISIPSNTEVEIDLNSLDSNAFIASAPIATTPPQIMAIGDVNTGAINSFGRRNTITFIPGSFIDISPN